MRLVHVVSELNKGDDTPQFVIEDYKIKNGIFRSKRYTFDDDGEYYSEWVEIPVEIDASYMVDIHAKFIIHNGRDAATVSMGMANPNHLAYTYSIVVFEKPYHGNLYPDYCVKHAIAGVGTSNFGMYSYHFNEPEFHYDDSRLEYEVWEKLNLHDILIKKA